MVADWRLIEVEVEGLSHGSPCSPCAFRQALLANGADGEWPLKEVGLHGARMVQAEPRT